MAFLDLVQRILNEKLMILGLIDRTRSGGHVGHEADTFFKNFSLTLSPDGWLRGCEEASKMTNFGQFFYLCNKPFFKRFFDPDRVPGCIEDDSRWFPGPTYPASMRSQFWAFWSVGL